MLDFQPAGGAARPLGFSLLASLDSARQQNFVGLFTRDSSLLDLAVKLTEDGTWPVQFQANRGTCNAFSVLAAEELYHAYRSGGETLERLSAEFLYYHARRVPLSDIGFDVDPTLANLNEQGATFLAQVARAFVANGVCAEGHLPYRDDQWLPPDHTVPHIPDAATEAAQDRRQRMPPAEFAVNTKVFDEQRAMVWTTDIGEALVSEVFLKALELHRPVVASFAILRDPGQAAWYGHRAIDFGMVQYPQNTHAVIEDAAAGHSVCIVGFLPGAADGSNGHFVFRKRISRVSPTGKTAAPGRPCPATG